MRSAASLVLLSLLYSPSAQAQDRHAVDQQNIEVGDALVCETQEGVESYVAHYSGDWGRRPFGPSIARKAIEKCAGSSAWPFYAALTLPRPVTGTCLSRSCAYSSSA